MFGIYNLLYYLYNCDSIGSAIAKLFDNQSKIIRLCVSCTHYSLAHEKMGANIRPTTFWRAYPSAKAPALEQTHRVWPDALPDASNDQYRTGDSWNHSCSLGAIPSQ